MLSRTAPPINGECGRWIQMTFLTTKQFFRFSLCLSLCLSLSLSLLSAFPFFLCFSQSFLFLSFFPFCFTIPCVLTSSVCTVNILDWCVFKPWLCVGIVNWDHSSSNCDGSLAADPKLSHRAFGFTHPLSECCRDGLSSLPISQLLDAPTSQCFELRLAPSSVLWIVVGPSSQYGGVKLLVMCCNNTECNIYLWANIFNTSGY